MPMMSFDGLVRRVGNVPEVRMKIEQAMLTTLQGQATYEGKRFLCQRLADLGTVAAVPVLTGMLAQPATFDMALYALEAIPGSASEGVLVGALDRYTGAQLVAVENAIGRRRIPAAVSGLQKFLSNADPAVASMAAVSLGRTGTLPALNALKGARKTSTGAVQQSVLEGLLRAAESLAMTDEKSTAFDVYRELSVEGVPAPIRIAAVRALVHGSTDAPAIVMSALGGKDEVTRTAVLQAVQEMPTGETVRKIAGMLPQLSDGGKVQLLSALAKHPDAAILQTVTGALKEPSSDVRTAAVHTLSKIGTAASVRSLALTASSAQGTEQREARESLASLGAPGTDDSLTALLSSSVEKIRSEAVRAMRERRVPATVAPLLSTLKDNSPKMRQDAALALRLIAAERDIPALLTALLAEKADAPRRELENSIIATTLRIPDAARRDPAIISALTGTKDRENRMSLLRVLGKIGTPGALATIMPALKDRDKDVMLTAVRSLSEWPTPAAYEELQALASGTKDNTVRTLALRGAVRTTGLDTLMAHDVALSRYRNAFALTRTTEEKKQLLSLTGAAPSQAAFDIAVECLKDPALKPDAELALVTSAEGIVLRAGKTIAPQLEGLLGSSNPTVREKSGALLSRIERLEDFVTTWECAGPFTAERVNLFEHGFAPETREAAQVQWKPFPEVSDPANPVVLAFDKVFGGQNRVVYLRTNIYVPAAVKARLECGSDDGIKVWINGTLVHANNADRNVVPGDDNVPADLRQGWNAVLMKINQGGGEWGACMRVRNADGSHIKNIRYAVTQE